MELDLKTENYIRKKLGKKYHLYVSMSLDKEDKDKEWKLYKNT